MRFRTLSRLPNLPENKKRLEGEKVKNNNLLNAWAKFAQDKITGSEFEKLIHEATKDQLTETLCFLAGYFKFSKDSIKQIENLVIVCKN